MREFLNSIIPEIFEGKYSFFDLSQDPISDRYNIVITNRDTEFYIICVANYVSENTFRTACIDALYAFKKQLNIPQVKVFKRNLPEWW